MEESQNNMKEVRFDEWCKSCKFFKTSEKDDPCFTCLENGGNVYSHIPVRYDGPRPTTKKDWVAAANTPKG